MPYFPGPSLSKNSVNLLAVALRAPMSKPSRWERRDATPQVYPDSEVGAARQGEPSGRERVQNNNGAHYTLSNYTCLHNSING